MRLKFRPLTQSQNCWPVLWLGELFVEGQSFRPSGFPEDGLYLERNLGIWSFPKVPSIPKIRWLLYFIVKRFINHGLVLKIRYYLPADRRWVILELDAIKVKSKVKISFNFMIWTINVVWNSSRKNTTNLRKKNPEFIPYLRYYNPLLMTNRSWISCRWAWPRRIWTWSYLIK